MNTIKIDKKKTLMVAHRGLSYLEKENTMAAFIAAGNRSYFGIECDIHPTDDGKFVVVHDENLKRISGIDFNVEKNSLTEIQKINLLDNHYNKAYPYLMVPTLEEYLECCIKYEKKCVIEFKNLFSKDDIIKVLDIVKKYNYIENSIFISFYIENLKNVKKYDSNIAVQFLLEEYDLNLITECYINGMDIDIYYKCLDEEKINYLHSKGIKINVWTINDPKDAERLCRLGVDYITTDILE